MCYRLQAGAEFFRTSPASLTSTLMTVVTSLSSFFEISHNSLYRFRSYLGKTTAQPVATSENERYD